MTPKAATDEPRRGRRIGYAVALAGTALTLGVRMLLWPVVGDVVPHQAFYPTVALAAFVGGFRPGLLATALGAVAANVEFTEPHYRLGIKSLNAAVALPLFVTVSLVISGLCESLHRARRRIVADERRRAAEAVREAEERFRQMADNIHEIFWVADATLNRLLYVSPAYEAVWGRPTTDLYDRPNAWVEFVHPDDRRAAVENLERSAKGVFETVEYRVVRPDGSVRWLRNRTFPVAAGADPVARIAALAEDITDRKRAEQALRESEGRFRGTFENAAVGIAHCDLDGRYLRVNERYCRIVGRARGDLLGRTFRDITHPDDLPATVVRFDAVMRGEVTSYTQEKRLVRPDGTPVWVNLSVSLQRDTAGAAPHAIGVIEDVSERKRLEAETRRARDAAEAASRAKDEFLANVSHELRTPMSAILGMTDLVLDGDMRDDQRKCLRTVRSAADRLLVLLNDLLDFSKIEAGKMTLDPSPFSVREVVEDALGPFAAAARAKGVTLSGRVHADVPDELVGDAVRLRQVLLNLVGNAVKFTPAGEVVVRVEPAQDGGGAVRFAVTDTGIGIAPELHERVFRAFEQADTSTTRRFGGTGLGLSIASRLVAAMGGRITLDSHPGLGSTFAFVVRFDLAAPSRAAPGPVDPSPPARPADPAGRGSGAADRRAGGPAAVMPCVLLAEDDEFNAQLMEQVLARRGYRVRRAADGREALMLAAAGGADVMLLDVHMPEVDGFQVVRTVRERERAAGGHLPVVALTARSRAEDRRRCLAAGMDEFLTKPVRPPELFAVIERLTARPRPAGAGGPVLTPSALLAACEGDPALLTKLCGWFRQQAPKHAAELAAARAVRDPDRLRATAHKLAGMLAVFSAPAGALASEAEDRAAAGDLDAAVELAARVEADIGGLLMSTDGLTLERLHALAAAAPQAPAS